MVAAAVLGLAIIIHRDNISKAKGMDTAHQPLPDNEIAQLERPSLFAKPQRSFITKADCIVLDLRFITHVVNVRMHRVHSLEKITRYFGTIHGTLAAAV